LPDVKPFDAMHADLGFELWMVMEYHRNGSLLDYLLTNTLSCHQAQSFVYSIASGLHYLHVDIQTGAQIKPGIAHRDLKSRNILVRSNHTCCISDFGLAVRHVGSTGHVDISSINPRQGTKRNMAPEILDGTINFTKFESYKMVDMYCFGLIIWEIARRTSNRAEEYQLPYYQHVSHDPSLDDMRKVVCTDNIRPSPPSWWSNDEFLTLLSSLMQECWRTNPWARLSALRVKKNIIRKGLEKFEVKNGFSNHTFS
jgi:serine/threonine protein kinase